MHIDLEHFEKDRDFEKKRWQQEESDKRERPEIVQSHSSVALEHLRTFLNTQREYANTCTAEHLSFDERTANDRRRTQGWERGRFLNCSMARSRTPLTRREKSPRMETRLWRESISLTEKNRTVLTLREVCMLYVLSGYGMVCTWHPWCLSQRKRKEVEVTVLTGSNDRELEAFSLFLTSRREGLNCSTRRRLLYQPLSSHRFF